MTAPDLPAELKAALDAKLEGVSRSDAATRAALISKTYRDGGGSGAIVSQADALAYALALIFAVFLTNPSPICVLDEVDAPLDDHNVERFCNLLHEMTASTETRFIIITHNPITMARMNRLFGVTMAERGVSQLVSVDLENAVKILDQNVA